MRRVLAAVLVLLSFCSPLFARQNSDWGKVEGLRQGTPVWVELVKGVTLSGRFQSADAKGIQITLSYPSGSIPVEKIPRADVRRVVRVVRRPFLPDPHKMLVGGAIIGGAAGATAVAIDDTNDCQGCKG